MYNENKVLCFGGIRMSNFGLKCTQNDEYDEYGKLGEGEAYKQCNNINEYRKKYLTIKKD